VGIQDAAAGAGGAGAAAAAAAGGLGVGLEKIHPLNPVFVGLAAGGMAGLTSSFVRGPAERIKTVQQAGPGRNHKNKLQRICPPSQLKLAAAHMTVRPHLLSGPTISSLSAGQGLAEIARIGLQQVCQPSSLRSIAARLIC